MARRKGVEFSKRVKDEERRRWHNRNPGRENAQVEIHHIFNAQNTNKYDVPVDAVRSQENAVGVEKGFHNRVHREQTEEDQAEFAAHFKRLWRTLPLGVIGGIIAYFKYVF